VKALKSYQNKKGRSKLTMTAGVIIKDIGDLREWAEDHYLPDLLDELEPFTTYAVPYDYDVYAGVEAIILTTMHQILWIGQLAKMPGKFVLHIDGKHKLHHGGWLLITVGTHAIDYHRKKLALARAVVHGITHGYRPAVYMFCKQQETDRCIQLVLHCIQIIALKYFGIRIVPGLGCADHGKGIMAGFKAEFPTVPLAGCWPHIAWGLTHGNVLRVTHPRWEEVKAEMAALHLAQTRGMWAVMVEALGKVWGSRDRELNTIWSEKLCWPCDNWFIGFTKVPGATPSQQAQESWHNWGVMQRLSGELHASTTYLLEVSLAKVMTLDGEIAYACNPNTCNSR
jgi:hypothetical protein